MSHPDLHYWFALKDRVKSRCRCRCEFCILRPGEQLHHRHYRTWGHERPEDVMLLCDLCHRYLSGVLEHGRTFTVLSGSLAKRGDDGTSDSLLWRKWLMESKEFVDGYIRREQEEIRKRQAEVERQLLTPADVARIDAIFAYLKANPWTPECLLRRATRCPEQAALILKEDANA